MVLLNSFQTAEMPDFYAEGEYDLSGFAVGIVKKDSVIDGKNIVAGDVLIGLPSSGVHSNGFSLVRRLVLVWGILIFTPCIKTSLMLEEFLQPYDVLVLYIDYSY